VGSPSHQIVLLYAPPRRDVRAGPLAYSLPPTLVAAAEDFVHAPAEPDTASVPPQRGQGLYAFPLGERRLPVPWQRRQAMNGHQAHAAT
jgi:hypothetical protein